MREKWMGIGFHGDIDLVNYDVDDAGWFSGKREEGLRVLRFALKLGKILI